MSIEGHRSHAYLKAIVKNGTPPDLFMGPWDGRLTDTEMWNVVNYVRSLAAKKK